MADSIANRRIQSSKILEVTCTHHGCGACGNACGRWLSRLVGNYSNIPLYEIICSRWMYAMHTHTIALHWHWWEIDPLSKIAFNCSFRKLLHHKEFQIPRCCLIRNQWQRQYKAFDKPICTTMINKLRTPHCMLEWVISIACQVLSVRLDIVVPIFIYYLCMSCQHDPDRKHST